MVTQHAAAVTAFGVQARQPASLECDAAPGKCPPNSKRIRGSNRYARPNCAAE